MTASVTLDDKYARDAGRVLLTSTQALVRLPMMQHGRDAAAGLNTAGFISGYRGSPLGTYDMQLRAAQPWLAAAQVHFEPGLNEDLAATAVWGTQQANLLQGAKFDGVFAIWYGKGPGVDRSGDPIKHGNRMGTSRHGGVLVVFGDDHPGKSSTISHQSEQALAANGVPVLYPATVQEFLDFGLHGFALSRAAGVWVGFKCVNETVESTATVDVDPQRIHIAEATGCVMPPEGVHARFVFDPLRDEVRLARFKLPLAQAYVRANRLDRVTHDSSRRELGIVAAGKSWVDVVSALQALGLADDRAATLGIRVYKPAMIWPLEPTALAAFAAGHRELLFVEEKAAFMEPQAAHSLYNLPNGSRPRIVGKFDENAAPLLPGDIQLDPLDIALAIGARLRVLGAADEALIGRLELIEHAVEEVRSRGGGGLTRTPYFCSGCPHNTSTKVPEGSVALAGIGCHTMAMGMNRNTLPPTQMGGEGANWTGIARFSKTSHVFQNLGDGTYVHSGLLAVRAAVIAGVNVTYKILVNDVVAMTGGQPVEGHFSVAEITHQLRAERVRRIAVVSDDTAKYGRKPGFADGVSVHGREEFEALQRELRGVAGVSALIYDQTCAAEKRRLRKRGKYPDIERRAFINEQVCEGCGDCSVQSNCVSIEPQETMFGRKRRINQSSCNKDYSCIQGFCPSFVSVEGGLRKAVPSSHARDAIGSLPVPPTVLPERGAAILITGIGGTGVVTAGAVLAMAAHIEGLSASVYDMTGLAQKGGAVLSHVRIAAGDSVIGSSRIGLLAADIVIGCDLVVTASPEVLRTVVTDSTWVLVNTHLVPTAAFQQNPNIDFHAGELLAGIAGIVGEDHALGVDATDAASLLLGDTMGANMFMVGYALQKGLLPVGAAAIERAIELNGVAVPFNAQALALGRFAAHDPAGFASLTTAADVSRHGPRSSNADDPVGVRERVLTAYQNTAYMQRYRDLVDRVAQIERAKTPGSSELAQAVAKYYFKLLAYKDEYEVARLYTNGEFRAQLDAAFAPGYRLKYEMAPPLLARKDPATGQPRKMQFGGWIEPLFSVLAKFKFLRGTALDPFGYTAERRQERRLIAEYVARVEELMQRLSPENHALAVQIASLPETIRGYGHVKQRHQEAAYACAQDLMARWRDGAMAHTAT